MKKVYTVLISLLLANIVISQVPQRMSFQSVVRNALNQLLANQPIGIQISILQGSVTGTSVYVETQTTMTNENGLATIEIGGGAPVTGTFAGIDWSTGRYYLKADIDPTGGTNYSITSTSQLLSVPYALYALKAKTSEGHYVGELYGGGVVFSIEQNGTHGLICSMIDLSTFQAWSNVTDVLIGPTAQSYWDGQSNTNAIIAQAGHTTSAAKLCADYTNADYGTGVYSDWYLPARGELEQLYGNLFLVQKALDRDGNAATTVFDIINFYWSSSEYSNGYAWTFNGGYGGSDNGYSKASTGYVRAVRAF